MAAARRIAVVTGTRAEYGIWRPVLAALRATPGFAVGLLVCGAHLAPGFGDSLAEIVADGHPVSARLPTLQPGDSAASIAASIGAGVAAFGRQFAVERPDLLMLLGDRHEMLAAAVAAGPFGLPVAHLHGGELSEGSLDDAMRHAITKLSHLHFVSTECYRGRVIQLGEAPDRVFTVGAPGLDAIRHLTPLTDADLSARIGLALDPAPLVVTYHPHSLDAAATAGEVAELAACLAAVDRPLVLTHPGADAGWRTIAEAFAGLAATRPNVRFVKHLGSQAYLSLLGQAAAMVGNSSSGIIEAPSFGLPVVNVGDRQRGRVRGANVIDVAPTAAAIAAGIARALDPAFRAAAKAAANPYGDGRAAPRIAEILRGLPDWQTARDKRFYDIGA